MSYVVRLIPQEEFTTNDVMFDALCIQRARCLVDIERRIQYYRNLREEERQEMAE